MSLIFFWDCGVLFVRGCRHNGDPSKYWSVTFLMGWGMFFVLGVYVAFAAFGADRIIGSCDMSIHPLFQSTLGWKAANQGYPKIALWSPRSER